ncbi:class I SAM-dependent methyltransferase [Campylobacter jejuni]|nr:class I SAM-dependent methyltransferase [Campylobacter jejuni]ELY7009375.1 class I SAM-dependent methyltransferase [Campylobacter jejuni]
MNTFNVKELGQVFTPQYIVSDMMNLIQNNGRFLEPSCGDGAFFKNLPSNKVGIEIDKNVINDEQILNIDFFNYPLNEKFDTIVGNPPYVKYQDIKIETKILLKIYNQIFDERSNLYLFFIYKCILHLKDKGELIFITPRDFLKSTSSIKLNNFLFSQGSITDFIDLGDKKIFKSAQPNCAIWRFEKGNFKRNTNYLKEFNCINGQILFTKTHYFIPFSKLFFVKVGAVSGADQIFTNEKFGNMEFVCSSTKKTKKTKKMIYGIYGKTCKYLIQNKEILLTRKIKKFNENNWWQWGRDYYKSDLERIYVNTKTRNKNPFFINDCKAYDGSILAIFPKFKCDKKLLQEICDKLNEIDWEELGFVCDGRFLFSQRSLENCLLNENFKDFLKFS